MVRIGGPTVVVDLEAVAAQFNHALGAVVAVDAERLQLAEFELIPILVMLFDMVGDRCLPDDAICQTHAAQRLGSQLQRAAALPPSCAMRMLVLGHKSVEKEDRGHTQNYGQPER